MDPPLPGLPGQAASMKPLVLTPREERDILRRREAKGRQKLSGPKLEKRVSPKATRGRELDKGYLAWLRRLPCVACAVKGGYCGPTQAAHLRFSDAARGRINPGMGNKPSDRYATPLGAGHHLNDQHGREERAFWADLGIDPGQLADDLYAAFGGGADGVAVVLEHARRAAA